MVDWPRFKSTALPKVSRVIGTTRLKSLFQYNGISRTFIVNGSYQLSFLTVPPAALFLDSRVASFLSTSNYRKRVMTSNLKIGATETSPVYFCYGASGERGHTLTAVGEASSPWVGHGVSVNPAAGQTLPFQTVPASGDYQKFSEQGCEWKVNCPNDGEELAFDCRIHTEFTAEPFSIPVKLGHYLREFLGKRNPIGAPLINEEVTAEVQVVSAYTQKLLKDVDVEWSVGGQPAGTKKTNDLGWSTFSHTFTADGEQSITAKVFNPYDDTTIEHGFAIRVYADSPWKQADLKVNGLPVAWRSPVVLRRGHANEVTVKVEPAIAKKLRLALINEEGLNIVSAPDGTVWQLRDPVSGEFKWTLTSNEQKSGRVRLVIYSQEVAQPWEHDGRVLAGDLADEVEVRIDGKPVTLDSNFFFRDQPGVITLVPKEGSSVIEGVGVTQICVITSGLDDADLVSSPVFGVPTPDHRWSVTGYSKSGTFRILFACQGIPEPITLEHNVLLSNDLADEVTIEYRSFPIKQGQVFSKYIPNILRAVTKPDSPLPSDYPISLSCDSPTIVNCKQFGPHGWLLTGAGTKKSGAFGMSFSGKGMAEPMSLPENFLLSDKMVEEVDVLIDGNPVSDPRTIFVHNRPRIVTATPKNDTPLLGRKVTLKRLLFDGVGVGDLISEPGFDLAQTQPVWKVTGNTGSGGVALVLEFAGVSMQVVVQCVLESG
jgi:hypothetical protein